MNKSINQSIQTLILVDSPQRDIVNDYISLKKYKNKLYNVKQ